MTENYIVLVPNQTTMLMLKYSYAFMLLLLQLAIFFCIKKLVASRKSKVIYAHYV